MFISRLKTVKELYNDAITGQIVSIDLSEDDIEKFAFGATCSAADVVSVRDSDDSGDEGTADKSMKDLGPVRRRPVYPPSERDSCDLFNNCVGLHADIEHMGNNCLRREDIDSLLPGTFLNDEVINEYMYLLARCRPGTHVLTSFTYTQFCQELYSESPT